MQKLVVVKIIHDHNWLIIIRLLHKSQFLFGFPCMTILNDYFRFLLSKDINPDGYANENKDSYRPYGYWYGIFELLHQNNYALAGSKR